MHAGGRRNGLPGAPSSDRRCVRVQQGAWLLWNFWNLGEGLTAGQDKVEVEGRQRHGFGDRDLGDSAGAAGMETSSLLSWRLSGPTCRTQAGLRHRPGGPQGCGSGRRGPDSSRAKAVGFGHLGGVASTQMSALGGAGPDLTEGPGCSLSRQVQPRISQGGGLAGSPICRWGRGPMPASPTAALGSCT